MCYIICMGRKQTKQVPLEVINELYYYQDGRLHHKIVQRNGVQAGDVVGCLHGSGYLITSIKKKQFQVHRLIYQLCHQIELASEVSIDHIDGNKLNNLIENLRPCTFRENACNKKKPSNNTSGYKNISKSKIDKREPNECWKVHIRTSDSRIQKNFPYTEAGLADAITFRDKMLPIIHGEFHNLG